MFVSRKMFWGRINELAGRIDSLIETLCSRNINFNRSLSEKLSRDEVKTCADCGCLVHVNAAIEIEPKVEKCMVFPGPGDPCGTSPYAKYDVKPVYVCKRCMADRADKELAKVAKVIQKAAREYLEALFPDVPPPTTDTPCPDIKPCDHPDQNPRPCQPLDPETTNDGPH